MKIFILQFALLTGILASDYCNPNLCRKKPHIGCKNHGKLSPSCPADAEVIELTHKQKELILHHHNQLRSKIASGNQSGFEPARRMATMRWNSELAKLAVLNVKTCDFEHDKCRNTDDFKFAGQNLAMRGNSKKFPEIEEIIPDCIHSWYQEHEKASQSDIDKYPDHTNGRMIGHFTQVVTAAARYVGCGAIRFTEARNRKSPMHKVLLTCDYSRTNLIGNPIYEAGPVGADCKTGFNVDYYGLCSDNEVIDPNEF